MINVTMKPQIGPRNCKYTLHGVKIAELRKVKLYPIAEGLDVPYNDRPKNDILIDIMTKLDALRAEPEISELGETA